ncbi:PVC-type heme-binding CxxCH protein [Pareuzebyella sediminis]|uniref:PVC-type heme-binding CxxCH protein n=1 Tax=Pareuzebyella sediminis TaxID=2607998 RepID=UPI001E573C8A|nr:PVC-type heme-binding CxxCH protein [Pareuzebyella sediminis]
MQKKIGSPSLAILGIILGFLTTLSCSDPRKSTYETPDLNFKTTVEKGLIIPENWEVTLWAESPSLYNPTNIDVDAKGRVWVTEAVNYRDFNNDPKKHLSFEKGDRIMILEDTNGDGVSDSSKVFVQDEDLVAPMGIAVVGNKVFVSCAPSLFVYTDENGDDIPDKKEVFLTGFGGFDHDHSLHSLVAGPDGKYYFNTGNAGPHHVVDKSGWELRSGSVYTGGTPYNDKNEPAQVSDDDRIWVGGLALRINPDGTGLKVMGHNFRNSYEVALDSYGNMWQNDNDDQVVTCRVTWLMEGGNAGYFSANGKRTWQADRKPEQEVFSAHWHQEDPGVIPAGDNTGAGSPTGVLVYEGDAFGPEYRGMLLSADAGRNVIFAYQPSKKGAGFDLKRRDLVTSVQESTEGYVWNEIDDDERKWFRPSDVAASTDGSIYIADWYDPVVGGHQMMDSVGYGRIYRLTPKGKELKTPKIDLTTKEGQIEALLSPAINVRNSGFQKLVSQGEEAIEKVQEILKDDNPYHSARAIWLLSELGQRGSEIVVNVLKNEPDPRLRVVAYRALRQHHDSIVQYANLAVDDPAPEVRREVAISLRDESWEDSKGLIKKLYHEYDGLDLWYLEALGIASEDKEEEVFSDLVLEQPKSPTEWQDKFASLVWRLHPTSAAPALKERAMAETLNEEQKRQAITALAFIKDEEAVKAMLELSEHNDNAIVKNLAQWWVDFRKTNDWYSLWDWQSESGVNFDIPDQIAALENTLMNASNSMEERTNAGQKLATTLIGGRLLINLAAENRLPETLLEKLSEAIFSNPEMEIRTLAADYFKKPEEEKYIIPDIIALSGNESEGENIFITKCATCHTNGAFGNDIGPDLTAIGKKFDKSAMLDAIIHPNASIVFGYEPIMIKTKSGQAFYGFLLSEGETTVIKDMGGKQIVIAPSDIETKEHMKTSIMPNAKALGLTNQNLADLSTYLLTLKKSSS